MPEFKRKRLRHKLTLDEVLEFKRCVALGFSQYATAKIFGITTAACSLRWPKDAKPKPVAPLAGRKIGIYY